MPIKPLFSLSEWDYFKQIKFIGINGVDIKISLKYILYLFKINIVVY